MDIVRPETDSPAFGAGHPFPFLKQKKAAPQDGLICYKIITLCTLLCPRSLTSSRYRPPAC